MHIEILRNMGGAGGRGGVDEASDLAYVLEPRSRVYLVCAFFFCSFKLVSLDSFNKHLWSTVLGSGCRAVNNALGGFTFSVGSCFCHL